MKKLYALGLLLMPFLAPAQNIVNTIAGTGIAGYTGDGVQATTSEVSNPCDVVVDASGNIIFSDYNNNRIRKINTSGIIATIAGTGTYGFAGDGGPATAAQFKNPYGLALDDSGNLYVADCFNERVRKINPAGIITTIAGTGVSGFGGDGGPATAAVLYTPNYVSVDNVGNVYITDNQNHRIRKVTVSTGIITTFAGTGVGGYSGDGVAASASELYYPAGTRFDASGNCIIADYNNHRIRKVSSAGIISTIGGTGTAGYSGDGGAATAAQFNFPVAVSIDGSGNIYVSDLSNNRVRLINRSTGIVNQFAGTGTAGFNGDGLLATATQVNKIPGMSVYQTSELIICDGTNNRVRLIHSDHRPNFINGNRLTISVCENSAPDTFTSQLAVIDSDAGQTETWTLKTPPVNGTAYTSFTMTSTGGILTPLGLYYQPNTSFTGTDSFKVQISDGTLTDSIEIVVTVTPLPVAGVVVGPSTICAGTPSTFTDTVAGGTWSVSSTAIATIGATTGIVTGVAPGIDTIICVYVNSCGTARATAVVTVSPLPNSGTISGASTVCVGAHVTLSETASGGTWSMSNGNATISAGVVTGVAAGTDTVSYTVSNSCGSATALYIITITTAASAGTITGATSVCVGGSITLSDAVSGGTWTVTNTDASVVGGVVTGLAVGSDTVKYTVSGSCGTAIATYVVNVSSGVAAITPATPITVCVGNTTTLADATSGGTWSSSASGTASVTSGAVTGLAAGTATITYTVGSCYATKSITVASGIATISPATATICTGSTATLTDATLGGTWSSTAIGVANVSGGVVTGSGPGTATISYVVGGCYATAAVTVNSAPAAISPSTPAAICAGSTVSLTDATSGGTWTSGSASASVSASGVVTGISAGVAPISYSIGSCSSVVDVTVNAAPVAIAPTSLNICVGATATVTDAVAGGAWTSAASGTASVSLTGIVTGVAPGNTSISYTIGTCSVSIPITVNPLPTVAAITGASTAICAPATLTLTDATTGGTWSSANSFASVSGGVVTGLSAGVDTISYTVSGSCGSALATYVVTVSGAPAVSIITGANTLCQGSFTIYTDSVSGGAWSVTNANATITGTGVASGVTSGVDTIVYTFTNACGTISSTKTVTVSGLPASGPVVGTDSVCTGATTTFTDAVAGGLWSVTNTHASVGVTTGIVTGATSGWDTLIYTVTNICGSTRDSSFVNVLTAPAMFPISGSSIVCIGSVLNYTDASVGGTWSMTNGNATITTFLGTGAVTGISLGLDTILYSVTNACGTTSTSKAITISPYPVAGVISGPAFVCQGANITLSETMSGGVWSSLNTAVATVAGATGIVTGVAAGTDTVSYTITGACGIVGTWTEVVVNPLPDTGSIAGTSSLCIGSTVLLTESVSGGTWSGGAPHASVSVAGLVTGLSKGTGTISYGVTNSCGTLYATFPVTIDTFPVAGAISWTDGVCVGSAVTLIDTVPGGLWSASNATAAVIAPGVIQGITPGVDTIFYTVTNTCGTAQAIKILPVNAVPVVAGITGADTICIGSSEILGDATSSGVWASSNSSIATVDISSGLTHGIAAGNVTITYTVTNSLGCPTSVTFALAVEAVPVMAPITGTPHECVGGSSTLADATAGGTWSSNNTAIATVDATGVVSGVSAGTAIITYSINSVCGTSFVTAKDTVYANPTVAAITGSAQECLGSTATLADATSGGVWSSANVATATVAAGVVTGIAAGNVTISYTLTGAGGCATSASVVNTVNPLPVVAGITGAADECVGGTAMLADATGSGTWTSSNVAVATITSSGIVTGVSAGLAVISYGVTDGAGCTGYALVTDTVNTLPTATAITGSRSVCDGGTRILADATLWGTWSSSNTGIVTVNATTGTLTGISTGSAIISYSVTNACGSVTDTAMVTVISGPTVAPITGATMEICAGGSTNLTDATTGGVWTSLNTSVASVTSTTGWVTGIVAGTDTIMYTVTDAAGCATTVDYVITFGTYLGSGSIAPAGATLCGGSPVNLSVVTSAGGLTYQWLLNGNALAGATNYNYTADSAGTYSAVLSNGTCEETVAGAIVSNPPTPSITFTAPNILSTGLFAGYQWYLNGVAIPGATNATYLAAAPGNYTVVVADGNGCVATSPADSVRGGGSGTGVAASPRQATIHIYPNPATTELYIDAGGATKVEVRCADGRKVMDTAYTKTLDISNLSDGMYMLVLYDADGQMMTQTKFVKQ